MNSIRLENSYVSLPTDFYRFTEPEKMPDLKLFKLNVDLASLLELDKDFLLSDAGLAFLGGHTLPKTTKSISLAYAGHQFGQLVPQLGDGRALLLGDKICRDGQRRDIQLKGSGRTLFSRSGDGRAGIGPVLREYLVSESMHHLGIASTRSLAILLTGERVVREKIQPGAILARVANSHVRVGTFQFFAIRDQKDHVQKLADFMINRSYPHLNTAKNKYKTFLENIVAEQASLIASWMSVGFIHGVMNTDNTSISCETIDYGPCAFMDAYKENKVFSSIDQFGRYSYSNQPLVAPWNLSRLAESILFLLSEDLNKSIKIAENILKKFANIFQTSLDRLSAKKLGFHSPSTKTTELYVELLRLMELGEADFTLTFNSLEKMLHADNNNIFLRNFTLSDNKKIVDLQNWLESWHKLLDVLPNSKEDIKRLLKKNNPIFIPRNHIVENIIEDVSNGDLDKFHAMCMALKKPYDEKMIYEDFYKAPNDEDIVHQTFCGT